MNNLGFNKNELENGTSNKVDVNENVKFEDALMLAGSGKFHMLILLTTGLSMSGVIMESLGMSFVLPAADCDLDMSLAEKGLLSASAFLGLVLSAYLWGFLADTQGRRFVIKWSLLLAVCCSWISALSHQAWLLIVMRFLTGFIVSGAGSTAYAYLGEFHGDKTRARAISWAASFISLGMVLLPAIAWGIIPLEFSYLIPGLNITFTPWRLYILICSFPNALALAFILFFPETPKFLLNKGKFQESLDVLARMYASNKGGKPSDYPVKSLDTSGLIGYTGRSDSAREIAALMMKQTVPLFKAPLLKYTSIICLVQFGIFAVSSGMFMWFPIIANYIMLYYDEYHEYNDVCTVFALREDFINSTTTKCESKVDPHVFILTLILGVGFSLTYIGVGIVINILGNKNILIFALTLCGSAGIALLFVSEYYSLVTLFGIFLACGVCVGLVSTIVVDLFPTSIRAMALCLTLMVGRLGASAGSNIVGYMLEYNCHGVFILFGAILYVCAILIVFIPSKNPHGDKIVTQTNVERS